MIDDHDNDCQQQLRQRQSQIILMEPSRQRQAKHMMSHRDIHQCQQETDGQNQPSLQLRRFPVNQRIFFRCQFRCFLFGTFD